MNRLPYQIKAQNDYYSFGSVMQTRSYSSGAYRFAFNSKEIDNENNSYDYGFRIYNSSVSRFLSSDPLKSTYVWNSSYAFAENKPIKSIDLDGLEELSVITPDNQNGFVKQSTITIKMIYYIVTEGKGAVHNFPKGDFHDLMSGEQTIIVGKLPSAKNEMEVLEGRNLRLAKKALKGDEKAIQKLKKRGISEVFHVKIQYDIIPADAGTIENANKLRENNAQATGMIMNQMSPEEIEKCPFEIRKFLKYATVKFSNHDVGGVATNEQAGFGGLNLVLLPTHTSMDLSISERAAHESGHNLSFWHVHCMATDGTCESREYEYSDLGLGSNTEPYMSTNNLINIINDARNRKTIR